MYNMLEILLTRLRLLKEYIISLVFLKVNQVSLSTAFIWSQLKFWSSSYQCFAISYFLLSQFFTRSSRPEVFCKKGVLRNFTKFTGKHLCQRLFFNNVAGLRPATLLKKRRWHRCFHANFVSIFSYKTPLMASSIFCVHLICYIHRSKLLHSYYSQFHKRCCFHLLQLLDL